MAFNVLSDRSPAVALDTYPTDLRTAERWLTWKETADGRKVPRAPYLHTGRPELYVDAQDPAVWTAFGTARDWAAKLAGFELAFTIRDRETHPDEDLLLVDYDTVRNPETGTVHPTVRDHLVQADSYADVSPSQTGIHILCRGALPEDIKSINDALPPAGDFPDADIEVYDSARFVAMTGAHIQETPRETAAAQAFVDDLVAEFATVTTGTPAELIAPPTKPQAAIAAIETTTNIQDMFDAIQHTGPDDIHLRSAVTEERSDGSKSLDPCWTTSESGTRLAQVDGGWIYRKGMIGLDALQVVALEEGIITDERTYPSGKQFWAAVEALRERGAHIPQFAADSRSP